MTYKPMTHSFLKKTFTSALVSTKAAASATQPLFFDLPSPHETCQDAEGVGYETLKTVIDTNLLIQNTSRQSAPTLLSPQQQTIIEASSKDAIIDNNSGNCSDSPIDVDNDNNGIIIEASCGGGPSPPVPPGSIVFGYIEPYLLGDSFQECLYGVIFLGKGLYTGDSVAIKLLVKEKIEEKELDRDLPETPLAEVFFSPHLHSHRHIFTIREVFEMELYHLIVSDLAQGEDLLELLKHHPTGMPDMFVRYFMLQAARALDFCHAKQITMQDFSLENCLLFIDSSGSYQIRVCDPGQAVRFVLGNDGEELPTVYTGCVGKKFRAPEIFTRRPYLASKVDSWCLGWSTFYLLFAVEIIESAWEGDQDNRWQLFQEHRFEELFKLFGVQDRFNPVAKDFILRLMHPIPELRMSIAKALKHPFLSGPGIATSLGPLHLKGPNRSLTCKNEISVENKLNNLTNLSEENHDKRSAMARERLAISPIIPEIYFKFYASLYCLPDKPSGSLLPFPFLNADNNDINKSPLSSPRDELMHEKKHTINKNNNSFKQIPQTPSLESDWAVASGVTASSTPTQNVSLADYYVKGKDAKGNPFTPLNVIASTIHSGKVNGSGQKTGFSIIENVNPENSVIDLSKGMNSLVPSLTRAAMPANVKDISLEGQVASSTLTAVEDCLKNTNTSNKGAEISPERQAKALKQAALESSVKSINQTASTLSFDSKNIEAFSDKDKARQAISQHMDIVISQKILAVDSPRGKLNSSTEVFQSKNNLVTALDALQLSSNKSVACSELHRHASSESYMLSTGATTPSRHRLNATCSRPTSVERSRDPFFGHAANAPPSYTPSLPFFKFPSRHTIGTALATKMSRSANVNSCERVSCPFDTHIQQSFIEKSQAFVPYMHFTSNRSSQIADGLATQQRNCCPIQHANKSIQSPTSFTQERLFEKVHPQSETGDTLQTPPIDTLWPQMASDASRERQPRPQSAALKAKYADNVIYSSPIYDAEVDKKAIHNLKETDTKVLARSRHRHSISPAKRLIQHSTAARIQNEKSTPLPSNTDVSPVNSQRCSVTTVVYGPCLLNGATTIQHSGLLVQDVAPPQSDWSPPAWLNGEDFPLNAKPLQSLPVNSASPMMTSGNAETKMNRKMLVHTRQSSRPVDTMRQSYGRNTELRSPSVKTRPLLRALRDTPDVSRQKLNKLVERKEGHHGMQAKENELFLQQSRIYQSPHKLQSSGMSSIQQNQCPAATSYSSTLFAQRLDQICDNKRIDSRMVPSHLRHPASTEEGKHYHLKLPSQKSDKRRQIETISGDLAAVSRTGYSNLPVQNLRNVKSKSIAMRDLTKSNANFLDNQPPLHNVHVKLKPSNERASLSALLNETRAVANTNTACVCYEAIISDPCNAGVNRSSRSTSRERPYQWTPHHQGRFPRIYSSQANAVVNTKGWNMQRQSSKKRKNLLEFHAPENPYASDGGSLPLWYKHPQEHNTYNQPVTTTPLRPSSRTSSFTSMWSSVLRGRSG